MSDERAYLQQVFLQEAWDIHGILTGLGPRLRDLPGLSPEDLDVLAIVAHRLKGAASLNQLARVAALGARLERLAGGATTGEVDEVRAEALDDYLALLAQLLDTITATGSDTDHGALSALAERHGYLEGAARQVDPRVTRMVAQLDTFRRENAEALEYFLPEATDHLDTIDDALLALERGGPPADEIDRLFRAVHTLKGAAYVVGCDPVGDLAHEVEDRLVAVRDGAAPVTTDLLEGLFFGAAGLRALVAAAGGNGRDLATRLARAFGGLHGDTGPRVDGIAPESQPAATPLPSLPETTRADEAPAAPVPTVRVRLDRLERLMNVVGELVLTRARLERRLARLEGLGEDLTFARARMTEAVREFEQRHAFTRMAAEAGRALGEDDPGTRAAATDLANVFSELEFDRYDDFNLFARRATEISADLSEVQGQVLGGIRGLVEESDVLQQLTRALRGEVTRARMLPLAPLWVRLERQVRELGHELGRPVELHTEGGAVELDSRVVHDLADCLLHLVQNALVHGLEPEAERVALGKPAAGSVRVRAEQQGARILIEVRDDGRGIDPAAIRRAAVARGFLDAERAAALSESECLALIFRAGFSTAAEVSTAAGRGVGLDAVRAKLRGLRGEVRVESVPGEGSRFRILLPLTVVISDALLLRSGGLTFGFPLSAVREVRQLEAGAFAAGDVARYRSADGDLQPAFPLEHLLGLPSALAPGAARPLVVVEAGERQYGLAVDEIVGKEEAVLKSLGSFLDGAGPYTGAVLTGAGDIVLILDPLALRAWQASPAAPAASAPVPEARPAGRRVLLVDDSISVRRVVGAMLERGGFEVTTAVDGVDALERLATTPVDLVLTDLEMPRLNGFELLQDVRRRAPTRDLPVLVLTSRSGAKHEALARQLGATGFLAKPVQEDALLAAAREAAAGARAPALVGGGEVAWQTS
ncbi:MAG: response regulator [Gemmatimonadetes bacterium]|nr:response regulator [Gemmatimonadota bacterium]MBK7785310.1 response regulator [Gemmatimonadota bacterium]